MKGPTLVLLLLLASAPMAGQRVPELVVSDSSAFREVLNRDWPIEMMARMRGVAGLQVRVFGERSASDVRTVDSIAHYGLWPITDTVAVDRFVRSLVAGTDFKATEPGRFTWYFHFLPEPIEDTTSPSSSCPPVEVFEAVAPAIYAQVAFPVWRIASFTELPTDPQSQPTASVEIPDTPRRLAISYAVGTCRSVFEEWFTGAGSEWISRINAEATRLWDEAVVDYSPAQLETLAKWGTSPTYTAKIETLRLRFLPSVWEIGVDGQGNWFVRCDSPEKCRVVRGDRVPIY